MILLYERGGVLRTIEFDATLRRVHLGTATPAEHPVQDEGDVTDNVHADAVRLSAECMVTNAPMRSIGDVTGTQGSVSFELPGRNFVRGASVSGGSGPPMPINVPFVRIRSDVEVEPTEWEDKSISVSAAVLQFLQPFNRMRDVHAELDRLRRTGTRLQVVTAITTYPVMVITSLTSPEDANEAIKFQIELKEVFIGEATLIDAPVPLERRAEKTKTQGAQATYDLPEQQKSVLKGGLEKLAALAVDSGVL